MRGRYVEVGLRSRFGPIVSMPPIHKVEIGGENALLGPEGLHQHREIGFGPLANPAAHRNQEEASCRLLTDSAGPAQAAAALVFLDGFVDGNPIEAIVTAEPLVLRRDHGG